jgi:phosphoglucosamine mutase
VNVPVRSKPPLEEIPEVRREIRAAEEAFGDGGRILVRYSGTELLARVMVEGSDGGRVEEHAQRIAAEIHRAIGA